MFQEVGSHQLVVDDGRTILFRGQHAPDEESTLHVELKHLKEDSYMWGMQSSPSAASKRESPKLADSKRIQSRWRCQTWPSRSATWCRPALCWTRWHGWKYMQGTEPQWCCTVVGRPSQRSGRWRTDQQHLHMMKYNTLLVNSIKSLLELYRSAGGGSLRTVGQFCSLIPRLPCSPSSWSIDIALVAHFPLWL